MRRRGRGGLKWTVTGTKRGGGGGIDEERDGMEAAHSLKNTGAGMEKEIKRDIA